MSPAQYHDHAVVGRGDHDLDQEHDQGNTQDQDDGFVMDSMREGGDDVISSPPRKKTRYQIQSASALTMMARDYVEVARNLKETVYSLLFPPTCQHPNCKFSAPKNEIVLHEKMCEYRMVPSPDDCCRKPGAFTQSLVPLRSLLEHIPLGKEADRFILSPGTSLIGTITLVKKNFTGIQNDEWLCTVLQFQTHIFLLKAIIRDKIFYIYVYILGDLEGAKNSNRQ